MLCKERMREMAEIRRKVGSEKAVSVQKIKKKKITSARCWLCSAGAGRKFLLSEQEGKLMAKENKMRRVTGFLNYSGVYK